MEMDHDANQIYVETMQVAPEAPDISMLSPTEDQVAARVTSPIVTTYIDTDKISFERWASYVGWCLFVWGFETFKIWLFRNASKGKQKW